MQPVILPANDVSYTMVVPSVYGQVMVNRFDTNQTNALIKTSSAIDTNEIAVMAQLASMLPEGSTVVDMGANFGLYTLAMAKACAPRGCTVHAFEAQRVIAYMVCGTLALNAVENAVLHHLAVGATEGEIDIPKFDYRQVSLDSMKFANVRLMKIDIEGMEEAALEGAKATIERDRPLCLVEWIKSDKAALVAFFKQRNYTVLDYGMNILCLPSTEAFPFQHSLAAL